MVIQLQIDPSEILLVGRWIPNEQGRLVADETCRRIEELIRTHLKEIGRDASGWDVLYRNPADGMLWELIHPQSQLHGDGPPVLRRSTIEEARAKFRNTQLL
jgi:Immunity protein 27